MTLTHHGGMDIEELDKKLVANVPFDSLTGLKAFVVANALSELNAPKELISPLVQQLPKLWELFHDFGMTTLELNPIRMRADRQGRLTPGLRTRAVPETGRIQRFPRVLPRPGAGLVRRRRIA